MGIGSPREDVRGCAWMCVRCRVALCAEALLCALSGGLSHKRANAPTKAHWLAHGLWADLSK